MIYTDDGKMVSCDLIMNDEWQFIGIIMFVLAVRYGYVWILGDVAELVDKFKRLSAKK